MAIATLKAPLRWLLRATVDGSKLFTRGGLRAFTTRQFASIAPGADVLLVGAGGEINGLLLRFARERGFAVTQIDVDPARNPDIVADICDWRAPAAYDVVVMCEVLEHVHAPARAIESVLLPLRPGGRLIATVPFIYPIHERPVDYFRYIKFGIRRLLAGFESADVRERDSWPEAMLVLGVRTAMSGSRRLAAVSPLFVVAALVGYPFAWALGRLFPADFLTSGYLVTAVKGGGPPG